MGKNRVPPSRQEKLSKPLPQRSPKVKVHSQAPAPTQRGANVALLIIGFICGILSLKIFDQYEQRQGAKPEHGQTTADTASIKGKPLCASIDDESRKKAKPVGLHYRDFRFEIMGRSGTEWVKIGPDRYMHLSDLEGIEKKKF